MSLFKTYPPSEITLDLLCCMTPKQVLEYIKDMHHEEQLRFKNLRAATMEFIKATNEVSDDVIIGLKEENKTLKEENIGLKDDRRAMAQIMEERAEQSAQTVRDLNEVIEGLREEIAILQQDAKEDKELRRLALEVCNGIDQGSCRLDHDTQEAYEELCALREELYGVPADEAPASISPVTPEQAWACFKDSKDGLWKECVAVCNEADFYPQTIQFSEWYVRDLDYGDIVAQGEGKPKKATIQEHYATGIWIRLYAFNKREEHTILTWFDGKEWVFEELITVD